MKNRIWIGLICVLLLAGGCVPSLHQLYTNRTVTMDDHLPGIWQNSDEEEVWTFREKDRGYRLSIVQQENDDKVKISELDVTLVSLYGKTYMDWYPADQDIDAGDYYKMTMLPVHLFVKVHDTDPNLVLSLMDLEKVTDLLKKSPDLVKHENREDYVILTAQPEELQQFIMKPEVDAEIWGDTITLNRISGGK